MPKEEVLQNQYSFFEEAHQQPKETTPKCFKLDYYEDKINLCTPGSENDYAWRSLCNYMLKVQKFYNALMSQLNSTIDNPIKDADFKKVDFSTYIIDKYAIELLEQEKKLMITFSKSPEKIAKKIEKHEALKEIRNYGAKCWLLYNNFKRENFYHSVIDFKSRNATKDLSKNRNIALMYVGHVKTKSFVKSKIKDYFSTNRIVNPFMEKHPTSIGIYANFNAEKAFKEIMQTFNGYVFEDNEPFFEDQLPLLTEPNAIEVVEAYKNYAEIKRVYKTLISKYEELKNGYEINYTDEDTLISSNVRQNLFEMAEKYSSQLNAVFEMAKQNPDYAFVLKDEHLINKLNQVINLHADNYNKIKQQKEEARKAFFGTHNNLNI